MTGSLPVRNSQPYVVLENHIMPKKFDIFIRFDTIPAFDRHATTAIAALTHSVAQVKTAPSGTLLFFEISLVTVDRF